MKNQGEGRPLFCFGCHKRFRTSSSHFRVGGVCECDKEQEQETRQPPRGYPSLEEAIRSIEPPLEQHHTPPSDVATSSVQYHNLEDDLEGVEDPCNQVPCEEVPQQTIEQQAKEEQGEDQEDYFLLQYEVNVQRALTKDLVQKNIEQENLSEILSKAEPSQPSAWDIKMDRYHEAARQALYSQGVGGQAPEEKTLLKEDPDSWGSIDWDTIPV